MNMLAFRCPNLSVFVLGLLLISMAGASAAEERQAREASQALATPRAVGALADQKCFATCFANVDKGKMGACLTACNEAAAVTLRSEDLVRWGLVSITKAACHSVVSCQPDHPSCAGWSGYSTCGDPYCQFQFSCGESVCHEGGLCFPEGGPARHVPYERFRVCFDQFSNPCTEWDRLDIYNCGGCEL
jgi:hypothetical protein